jgi:hypothetical protein
VSFNNIIITEPMSSEVFSTQETALLHALNFCTLLVALELRKSKPFEFWAQFSFGIVTNGVQHIVAACWFKYLEAGNPSGFKSPKKSGQISVLSCGPRHGVALRSRVARLRRRKDLTSKDAETLAMHCGGSLN